MAALPDLSENLINESQTWDEIQEIKAMPVPMAQKRELKNQLQVGIVLCFKTPNQLRAIIRYLSLANNFVPLINHFLPSFNGK